MRKPEDITTDALIQMIDALMDRCFNTDHRCVNGQSPVAQEYGTVLDSEHMQMNRAQEIINRICQGSAGVANRT